MEKEFYNIKLVDFIPLIGMVTHTTRCVPEEYNNKISDKLVNAGLMLYHLASIPIIIVAEGLLESLLKN